MYTIFHNHIAEYETIDETPCERRRSLCIGFLLCGSCRYISDLIEMLHIYIFYSIVLNYKLRYFRIDTLLNNNQQRPIERSAAMSRYHRVFYDRQL